MAANKLGLDKNTAAALSYVLGPITGVVFFLLEKDPFVRFHAMQSIIVLGVLLVLQPLMAATLILLPLTPLLTILTFVMWLMLIYRAWQGDEWVVPVLGQFVKKALAKVNK